MQELSIAESVHRIVLQVKPEDMERVAAIVTGPAAAVVAAEGVQTVECVAGFTTVVQQRRFAITVNGTPGIVDGTAVTIHAADLDSFWLGCWVHAWGDLRPLPAGCTSWAAAGRLVHDWHLEMFGELCAEPSFCLAVPQQSCVMYMQTRISMSSASLRPWRSCQIRSLLGGSQQKGKCPIW